MKELVLSEDDIAAVLLGEVPSGRPDLAELAAAVDGLRHAYLTGPPTPSAELFERLRGSDGAWTTGAAGSPAPPTEGGRVRPPAFGAGSAWKWLVGLGTGAKLGLGTTAVVVGLASAGVAGVLPDRAQSIVTDVIEELNPFDHDVARAEERALDPDPEPDPLMPVDRPRTETSDQDEIEQTPHDSGRKGDRTDSPDPDADPVAGPGGDSDRTDDRDPDADTDGDPGGEPDSEPDGDPDGEPEGEPDGDPESHPEGDPDDEPDVEPDVDPEVDPEFDPDDEPEVDREGDPDVDRPKVGQDQSDSDSSGG
jgi:hypothetical protein